MKPIFASEIRDRKCHYSTKIAMAAFPRLPVRSSSRRSASLDELPPTVVQQNPSDNTRLGKRLRDPPVQANESRSIKKQKLHSQEPAPPRATPRSNDAKPSTASGTVAARDAETQVEQPPSLDAVQLKGNHGSTATINDIESARQDVERANSPAEAAKQSEKRTLRSQAGGSRSKSELSWYFPNYEELVNDEPREPGIYLLAIIPPRAPR